MNVSLPTRLAVRRYLFWIRYDGCRFPEMARGGTGFGVMDLLQQACNDVVFKNVIHSDRQPLKFSPSSRTDAHVHALRNAVVCQVPLEFFNLDESTARKTSFLEELNQRINYAQEGLSVLDVHKVSAGFCIRRSVEYRRYTYRLAVSKDWKEWSFLQEDPSTACFSEQNYAWRIPPGFSVDRATSACNLFKGVHVMGSFFKQTEREKRKEPKSPNVVRNILHCGISAGEPYSMDNDIYDYYNVTVIARSFVREQIRRMMSCIVFHGYNRLPLQDISWLLANPISSNFFDRRIPIAPPNGLFLTDVVYDPKNFVNPEPYHYHSWDYDL